MQDDKSHDIDHFPCGAIILNIDGTIIRGNRQLGDWCKTDHTEFSGRNIRELLDRPSSIYHDLVIDPTVRLKGYIEEINVRFKSGGGYFEALLNISDLADQSEGPAKVTAIVYRVSARKSYEMELLAETRRAEEQKSLAEQRGRLWEFLFDSLPDLVWTLGPYGEVRDLNLRARECLGQLPLSRSIFALYQEDRKKTMQLWKGYLEDGRKFERDLRINDPIHGSQWFMVRAQPYQSKKGDIELWFCSATNIHKKKLLQLAGGQELRDKLSSAYQDLDQKSELLKQIADAQSHMVRKPVANILGLSMLIQDEEDPSAINDLMEKLVNSATELDQVIRDISGKTLE